MSGLMNPGDVILYKNSSAVLPSYATGTNSTTCNFNGDDLLVISSSTNNASGDVWASRIDVIGNGTNWGANKSFYRNSNITSTNITYTSSEWTEVSNTTVDNAVNSSSEYLGTHLIEGFWKISAGSNDWGTGSNWDDGNFPNSSISVVVRTGASNYPTIYTAASCNDITLESGASLIGAEYLTVSSGTATMQRTIDGYTLASNGWHLLSSPVNNLAIAGSDFEPGIATPNLDDFYAWSESGWEWLNYKVTGNSITNFVNGKGYLVSYETTATKDFTGTFNNSDVTFNNLSLTNVTYKGWHLVGNPFQSALQLTSSDWVRTNIGLGAKILNPGGSYTDITISGTDIIPANQVFFIEATVDNINIFTIPKSQRVHSSAAFYKSSANNMLTLKAINGNYYQESCIQFMDGATANYEDNLDVDFLVGISEEAPQFYSIVEDHDLSTNRIPIPENESSILMGFSTANEEVISIEAIGIESFSESYEILLKDLQEDITVDLRQNPVYTFLSKPDNDLERFRVYFKSATGINDMDLHYTNIQIYSSENTVYIINNNNVKGDIEIVNMIGQKLGLYSLDGTSKQAINFTAQTGLYIVNVKTDDGYISSQKIIISK